MNFITDLRAWARVQFVRDELRFAVPATEADRMAEYVGEMGIDDFRNNHQEVTTEDIPGTSQSLVVIESGIVERDGYRVPFTRSQRREFEGVVGSRVIPHAVEFCFRVGPQKFLTRGGIIDALDDFIRAHGAQRQGEVPLKPDESINLSVGWGPLEDEYLTVYRLNFLAHGLQVCLEIGFKSYEDPRMPSVCSTDEMFSYGNIRFKTHDRRSVDASKNLRDLKLGTLQFLAPFLDPKSPIRLKMPFLENYFLMEISD